MDHLANKSFITLMVLVVKSATIELLIEKIWKIIWETSQNSKKEQYEYLDIHYNYQDTNSTFLEIKCKKRNHIFFQNLSNHKNGSGCPDCNNVDNKSKGINRISILLEQLNYNFSYEKVFGNCKNLNATHNLRFDIFIEELNCCIEFDGPQHFKPVDLFGGIESFEKTKENDQIKNGK